ncbi:hypothetical protein [Deinococcus sonorensis]|uniref:Uncharacterized protein n=2 Tax=Deinococcus sonorensis TaxID=309891 RepID=A0AAU7UAB5_9DEIO
MTIYTSRPAAAHLPHPQQQEVQLTSELYGSHVVEVVVSGQAGPLQLDGWRLRLWPQARLGDATLELQAEAGRGTPDLPALLCDLQRLGYTPLGPLRSRISRP